MNLDNVLSGKFETNLNSLPDLILVVPKAGVITRLTPLVNKLVNKWREDNQDVITGYTSIDAERDLLRKYPDYYAVMEKAREEKNKILLTLSQEETPDERFLKTPEEIERMTPKEREKYEEYYQRQFRTLQQKYLENPVVKKSIDYADYKRQLYQATDDALLEKIRRIFWLILTAEKPDGAPYFKSTDEGFTTISKLDNADFEILFEMWEGVIEGFSLPF